MYFLVGNKKNKKQTNKQECLRWPFLSVWWGRFTGVCKFKKMVSMAVRCFPKFRIKHRKFCENITCNIFRELLVLDPESREVYNCHPYHFTEIFIPLRNKYADFIGLYGTPHLNIGFWPPMSAVPHDWNSLLFVISYFFFWLMFSAVFIGNTNGFKNTCLSFFCYVTDIPIGSNLNNMGLYLLFRTNTKIWRIINNGIVNLFLDGNFLMNLIYYIREF